MNQDRIQSWTRYWQGGALHSLSTSFAAGYAGELQNFWREVFVSLSPDDSLLDVGCGNAPLGLLLSECFPEAGRCPQYHGIDVATVAPPWWPSLSAAQRLRFTLYSNQAVETLSFADQSIDLIISQYGFEYTDFERSLPELRRVCRAGGSLAMVLHHAGSLPVRNARLELGHIDFLMAPQGLLEHVVPMFDCIALLASPDGLQRLRTDPRAAQIRAQYDAALSTLDQRVANEPLSDVLLDARNVVTGLLADTPRTGAAAAGRLLTEWREALRDARLRLVELVECALDLAQLERLAGALAEGTDSVVVLRPLLEQGEILGWTLRIQPKGT